MVSVTSLSASAVEITTETATLEDVVAGMADPSQLGGISARAATTSAVIEDGIYYVNGEYSGNYLKNSASSPAAESGTLSSLGTSIQWQITNVSNSFAIQSVSNSSKYLAVPTSSTSSSAVELVTISGTTIPTECLWNRF